MVVAHYSHNMDNCSRNVYPLAVNRTINYIAPYRGHNMLTIIVCGHSLTPLGHPHKKKFFFIACKPHEISLAHLPHKIATTLPHLTTYCWGQTTTTKTVRNWLWTNVPHINIYTYPYIWCCKPPKWGQHVLNHKGHKIKNIVAGLKVIFTRPHTLSNINKNIHPCPTAQEKFNLFFCGHRVLAQIIQLCRHIKLS